MLDAFLFAVHPYYHVPGFAIVIKDEVVMCE